MTRQAQPFNRPGATHEVRCAAGVPPAVNGPTDGSGAIAVIVSAPTWTPSWTTIERAEGEHGAWQYGSAPNAGIHRHRSSMKIRLRNVCVADGDHDHTAVTGEDRDRFAMAVLANLAPNSRESTMQRHRERARSSRTSWAISSVHRQRRWRNSGLVATRSGAGRHRLLAQPS